MGEPAVDLGLGILGGLVELLGDLGEGRVGALLLLGTLQPLDLLLDALELGLLRSVAQLQVGRRQWVGDIRMGAPRPGQTPGSSASSLRFRSLKPVFTVSVRLVVCGRRVRWGGGACGAWLAGGRAWVWYFATIDAIWALWSFSDGAGVTGSVRAVLAPMPVSLTGGAELDWWVCAFSV